MAGSPTRSAGQQPRRPRLVALDPEADAVGAEAYRAVVGGGEEVAADGFAERRDDVWGGVAEAVVRSHTDDGGGGPNALDEGGGRGRRAAVVRRLEYRALQTGALVKQEAFAERLDVAGEQERHAAVDDAQHDGVVVAVRPRTKERTRGRMQDFDGRLAQR